MAHLCKEPEASRNINPIISIEKRGSKRSADESSYENLEIVALTMNDLCGINLVRASKTRHENERRRRMTDSFGANSLVYICSCTSFLRHKHNQLVGFQLDTFKFQVSLVATYQFIHNPYLFRYIGSRFKPAEWKGTVHMNLKHCFRYQFPHLITHIYFVFSREKLNKNKVAFNL